MSTNIIGQTLLNQYHVDAFIAPGGMSTVYKVWDLKRNAPLAMKVLHADFAEDPSVFKRFQTDELARLFASITGYRYAPEGIPGQVTTGDAADWLTVNGITAVEVDLSSHETIDWEVNLQAFKAFINWDLNE